VELEADICVKVIFERVAYVDFGADVCSASE